jgi:hypothetical protein
MYKTLHRKLKIQQDEPYWKDEVVQQIRSVCLNCDNCRIPILQTIQEWGKDWILITINTHIRNHLQHRYSATVNQDMVTTDKR